MTRPIAPSQRIVNRFWARVDKTPDGCWLWMGARGPLGYGAFWDGKKVLRAHRYAWAVTNGEIPEGLFACHKCDNPPCVNPDHLFLGTRTENQRDMAVKERTNTTKLTESEVRAMRRAYRLGISQDVLAHVFGVDQTNVSQVVRRQSWPHIPEDNDIYVEP